jgi:hypothetical protein
VDGNQEWFRGECAVAGASRSQQIDGCEQERDERSGKRPEQIYWLILVELVRTGALGRFRRGTSARRISDPNFHFEAVSYIHDPLYSDRTGKDRDGS